MTCRMYKNEYPEEGDLVMTQVTNVSPDKVYVNLLEYNNKEGIILPKNLSRKVRMRTINSFVRVGQKLPMEILSVDEEKGYIDLIMKFIKPEDRSRIFKKYTKSKTVHDILSRVSEVTSVPLLDIYRTIGWPLYDKYEHCYDAFQDISVNPGLLVCENNDVQEELIKLIKHQFEIRQIRFVMIISLTCFSYMGIEAIKKALKKGIETGKLLGYPNVRIECHTSPRYRIVLEDKNINNGVQILRQICKSVENIIRTFENGNFSIVSIKADEKDILFS